MIEKCKNICCKIWDKLKQLWDKWVQTGFLTVFISNEKSKNKK